MEMNWSGVILDIYCLLERARGDWTIAFFEATSGKVFIGTSDSWFADFGSTPCLEKC
jgi:hypothetical protein